MQNIARFVNRLHDASHIRRSKLPFEHRPDRVAAFNWRLRHLMVDGVPLVEVSQAVCVSGVEPLDPAFDDFAR
jgi:hypothetical protein